MVDVTPIDLPSPRSFYMERLGDRTWKQYYQAERENRRDELEARARSMWEGPDPEVDRVLSKWGALSFPHTFIDASFTPLLRAVRAVHRSGKGKVLALGVVHSPDYDPEESEFSLDGLSFMLDLVEEGLGQPGISLERRFVTKDSKLTDVDLIVGDLEEKGRAIGRSLDDDTALLLTGDLFHYGWGYGTTSPMGDLSPLDRMVTHDLDLLYRKKRYLEYYLSARKNMNDQAALGIVTSTALGSPLDYSIFSCERTDYSEVLERERPTVVGSVLYGVYRT